MISKGWRVNPDPLFPPQDLPMKVPAMGVMNQRYGWMDARLGVLCPFQENFSGWAIITAQCNVVLGGSREEGQGVQTPPPSLEYHKLLNVFLEILVKTHFKNSLCFLREVHKVLCEMR